MTSSAEWARRMGGVIERAGGGLTVTLRRRNTLRNGASGARVDALAVVGAALAGATAVVLDGPSLQGLLEAGARLQLAGVTGTYEVATAANAAAGQLAVTLTAPLAGPAADDAVVTLTRGYGEYSYPAMRESLAEEAEGRQVKAMRVYLLSAVGATATPRDGDLLVEGDTETAVAVEELGPGGASAWRVKVAV